MVDFLASSAVELIEKMEARKSKSSSIWPVNIFSYSERVKTFHGKLTSFMEKYIYPNESVVEEALKKAPRYIKFANVDITEKFLLFYCNYKRKQRKKDCGIYFCQIVKFIHNSCFLISKYAPGLSNLEYAPLAEIMGR